MTKKVLVTGGTGFIGSSVVKSLKANNQDFIYTFSKTPAKGFEDNGVQIDLLSYSDLKNNAYKLKDVSDLVHTAALVPSKSNNYDERTGFKAYVLDSLKMLDNIISSLPNLKRIVFVSSCYVELDDKAIGFYGAGKAISETVIHRLAYLRGIDSISLRFPQVYGPGETHGVYINKFVELALANKAIKLDEKANTKRDALFIDDVSDSIIRSLSYGGNRTITISSDKAYSPLEIAEIIAEKVNVEVITPRDFFGTPEQHFESTYKPGEFHVQYSIYEGIDRTVDYYSHNR